MNLESGPAWRFAFFAFVVLLEIILVAVLTSRPQYLQLVLVAVAGFVLAETSTQIHEAVLRDPVMRAEVLARFVIALFVILGVVMLFARAYAGLRAQAGVDRVDIVTVSVTIMAAWLPGGFGWSQEA